MPPSKCNVEQEARGLEISIRVIICSKLTLKHIGRVLASSSYTDLSYRLFILGPYGV